LGFNYDFKTWWKDQGRQFYETIDMQIYRDQERFLVEFLQKECACNKIESVLEVGCGYGRITRLLSTRRLFPLLKVYVALDISMNLLRILDGYVGTSALLPKLVCSDFESWQPSQLEEGTSYYDLVISVETMTVIPSGYPGLQFWINKMLQISRKYIINLDWFQNPKGPPIDRRSTQKYTAINNPHPYDVLYKRSKDLVYMKAIPVPHYPNEHIFYCRTR
jgi:SAM-dependent methyltransferase